jgi:hypothetical protein
MAEEREHRRGLWAEFKAQRDELRAELRMAKDWEEQDNAGEDDLAA